MKHRILSAVGLASRVAMVARFSATILVVLTVAGCFETQHEVFGSRDGVLIPGLEGKYTSTDWWPPIDSHALTNHFTVARVPGTNDYRYTWSARIANGEDDPNTWTFIESRRFRAVAFGPSLYIMQSCDTGAREGRYPAKLYCDFYFFHAVRSGNTVARLEQLAVPSDSKQEADAIAKRDGVDMWDSGVLALSGSRAALAQFLRDVGVVAQPIEHAAFTRAPSPGQ